MSYCFFILSKSLKKLSDIAMSYIVPLFVTIWQPARRSGEPLQAKGGNPPISTIVWGEILLLHTGASKAPLQGVITGSFSILSPLVQMWCR